MIHPYNTERVGHIIEAGRAEILAAVSALVDDLCDHGAIRIHRAWGAGAERREIAQRAAEVAVLSVLTCDWAALDEETKWLYFERKKETA
jgi:hypothetical protein